MTGNGGRWSRHADNRNTDGAAGDGYYLFSNFPPDDTSSAWIIPTSRLVLANLASSTNAVAPLEATPDRNDPRQ